MVIFNLGLGVATLADSTGFLWVEGLLGVSEWDAGDYAILGGFAIAVVVLLVKLARIGRGHGVGRVPGMKRAMSAADAVRQLSAVLDMMSDGAAVIDPEGRVVWANAAMARILEMPAQGLEGTNITHLIAQATAVRDLGFLGASGAGMRAIHVKPPVSKTELRIVA